MTFLIVFHKAFIKLTIWNFAISTIIENRIIGLYCRATYTLRLGIIYVIHFIIKCWEDILNKKNNTTDNLHIPSSSRKCFVLFALQKIGKFLKVYIQKKTEVLYIVSPWGGPTESLENSLSVKSELVHVATPDREPQEHLCLS